MAFNRNNPTQLLELRDELVNDPITMGYGGIDTFHGILIPLLTDPANNVGGEVGTPTLTTGALWDILATEVVSTGDQFLIQLLFEATQGLQDDISARRAALADIDAGLGSKINSLTRPLSRADFLWGVADANGTHETINISQQDIGAARELP